MKLEFEPRDQAPSHHAAPEEIFLLLTGRWSLQILMALSKGHMRFNNLRRAIPKVSANVLTARLRELEAARLVVRSFLPSPDACLGYELGPLAEDLRPALHHLQRWKTLLSESVPAGGEMTP